MYRKPHAKVWTDGRVEEWECTGERPSVAVWTADQLATFLHGVTDVYVAARRADDLMSQIRTGRSVEP